jgi:hypothetical protein
MTEMETVARLSGGDAKFWKELFTNFGEVAIRKRN